MEQNLLECVPVKKYRDIMVESLQSHFPRLKPKEICFSIMGYKK